MRNTCEPRLPAVKSGLTTPLVPASESAAVGYQVRAPIGSELLNHNSWPHCPPHSGPLAQLLVPARLK